MIAPIRWLICGAVIVAAAVRADASARARRTGEIAVAAHYIAAGPPVNAYYRLLPAAARRTPRHRARPRTPVGPPARMLA